MNKSARIGIIAVVAAVAAIGIAYFFSASYFKPATTSTSEQTPEQTTTTSSDTTPAVSETSTPQGDEETNQSQQLPVKTFESSSFGIKVDHPADWVVDTSAAEGGELMGVMTAAVMFCPKEQALPAIGDKFSCTDSDEGVYIFRFTELDTSPAFSVLNSPRNITLNDIFAHTIQIFRDVGSEGTSENYRIVNQTDATVNMTTTVASESGKTVNQTRQLPARLFEYTYQRAFSDIDVRSIELVVLNDMTAYTVNHEFADVLNLYEAFNASGMGLIPTEGKVIFDYFELIPVDADDTAGTPMSPAPTIAGRIAAEVKPGSSTMTTNAYSPNPLNINVGDTVTWTNKDTQPHTVTSVTGGQPDGKFDSSPNFNPLMAPQSTFSHTFTEGGEYPYYCSLHPNMVGTVIVAGTGNGGPEPRQAAPDIPSMDDENSGEFFGNITKGIEDLFSGTGN